MGFRDDFIWGAATASYQVEGAAYADGKGLSVWDMFCRKQGAVRQGHTGENACDHYNRYREDVAVMKALGLKAYRFSVSWPRILPEGTGRINEKGLSFYDRLIDELLCSGIEPYITLFHWDYPYELYKKGGWLSPESPGWFAEYTGVVVDRLSDRVSCWITQNEPQCYIGLGHFSGRHAPGLKLDMPDLLSAVHNSHLSHGNSVMTIRVRARSKPVIGIALVGNTCMPLSDSPEDKDAAMEQMFCLREPDPWSNPLWFDPLLTGKYPDNADTVFKGSFPDICGSDMEKICQPVDFLGINIYNGQYVRSGAEGIPETLPNKPGHPRTSINWPVTPECLYWGPKFFYERYGKPIIITENGFSGTDWVSVDGKVHDPQRIDYLHRYIREYKKACSEGIDGRGYFCWSLMDNFEWAEGYNERFGLVHVDYSTQKRTVKDSGHWYKDLIGSNGRSMWSRQ